MNQGVQSAAVLSMILNTLCTTDCPTFISLRSVYQISFPIDITLKPDNMRAFYHFLKQPWRRNFRYLIFNYLFCRLYVVYRESKNTKILLIVFSAYLLCFTPSFILSSVCMHILLIITRTSYVIHYHLLLTLFNSVKTLWCIFMFHQYFELTYITFDIFFFLNYVLIVYIYISHIFSIGNGALVLEILVSFLATEVYISKVWFFLFYSLCNGVFVVFYTFTLI